MRGVVGADAIRIMDSDQKAPRWKAPLDFYEDGQSHDGVFMSEHQFFNEKTLDYEWAQEQGLSMARLGALYDFGYALTCHKMQGSQAPEVAVVMEEMLKRRGRDERIRWAYTAVTRAEKSVVIVR